VLCNDSSIRQEENEWKPEGDPTEVALTVVARKAGFDPEKENTGWPRIDAIPFSSERRYMATLNRGSEGKHYIYVKGAPERIFDMCKGELEGEDTTEFDNDTWLQRAEDIAALGQRVLAVARKEAGESSELDEDNAEHDLILLG
ncbi:MAG: cation-transporting P-type ATPase, partial [Desulfopila sp.]